MRMALEGVGIAVINDHFALRTSSAASRQVLSIGRCRRSRVGRVSRRRPMPTRTRVSRRARGKFTGPECQGIGPTRGSRRSRNGTTSAASLGAKRANQPLETRRVVPEISLWAPQRAGAFGSTRQEEICSCTNPCFLATYLRAGPTAARMRESFGLSPASVASAESGFPRSTSAVPQSVEIFARSGSIRRRWSQQRPGRFRRVVSLSDDVDPNGYRRTITTASCTSAPSGANRRGLAASPFNSSGDRS